MDVEARTIHGRELLPIGKMAGRQIFTLTSRGVRYRLVPDIAASYALRREADGYYGLFDSLEEAIDHIEALEAGE